LDTGEAFVVTGYDDKSRTIETQAIDGDLDEIDMENWSVLQLEYAEPPEDWAGAPEDVDVSGVDGSINPMEKFLSP
jgi:hypothetical protein